MNKNEEYAKFDRIMSDLLKVPHSKIKAELDAEKAAKEASKQKKRKSDDNRNA